MTATTTPPVYITATYFNQSVYLNIQTILNTVIKSAIWAQAEVRHELGLSGISTGGKDINGVSVASYDGWAIQNGAPSMHDGAWNWYLQNKILGGKAPLMQGPIVACHMAGRFHHKKRVCVQTGYINPSTSTGGPYPKKGDLATIVNNLAGYASNLQTELNRIHLPTPAKFTGWVNAIQGYAQTGVSGLALVSLYQSLAAMNTWLPTVQANLAAQKQADAVAAQQAAAASATAAQATQLQANTQAAAAQAAQMAAQQQQAATQAQALATSATQAAAAHAQAAQSATSGAASTQKAATAQKVANTAQQAVAALSAASQASQVASQNPTPNNMNAAAQAGQTAAKAVQAVNAATGKKSSIWPLALIAGGIALKVAGVTL